jgi:glycosyltransferase involved in cell wall biosynthesis
MNILFPEQSVLQGAAFYRTYQPLLALPNTFPDCQVMLLKASAKDQFKPEDFNRLMFGTDIFFEYFPGESESNMEALNKLDEYNIERVKVGRPPMAYVVDVDDWFFDCSPFNNSYINTGTENKVFKLTDDNGTEYTKEYIDGVTKHSVNGHMVTYDIERNKKLLAAKCEHIRKAHAVTCTTEALAAKLRTLNPNVYVLPNAIDFTLYEALPKKESEIRIGYAYSASHLVDWLDIMPALREYVNKTPFIKLVLMGEKPTLQGFELNKVECHPYVSIMDGYHKAYSALRCDIAIMPLFDDSFNACKSPLKALEAAAVKSAILAPHIVYGNYLIDNSTALLYTSNEEFKVKLSKLVSDKQLRKTLAENAHIYAHTHFDIEKITPLYYEAFKKIIEKGVEHEKDTCITV